VAASFLAVFKAKLDGTLSNLIQWKVSLPMAGGWNEMFHKVPSNLNHSMILRIHAHVSFRNTALQVEDGTLQTVPLTPEVLRTTYRDTGSRTQDDGLERKIECLKNIFSLGMSHQTFFFL